MPNCYLVSEIAVECNATGEQISSDISVCGIFTTDKLANDAVLTWHERDYVPVAAGDFDSYKLSKPEGLLHLVACAGLQSWEVSVEMIVMNTEFTMSLLDPSIPEESIPDVPTEIRSKPKKRIKVENKDGTATHKAGTTSPKKHKKKASTAGGDLKTAATHVKKEGPFTSSNGRNSTKDKEAAARRRKTLSSITSVPSTDPIAEAQNRRLSAPISSQNQETLAATNPIKHPFSSASTITTLKYSPSSRQNMLSAADTSAKKEDAVTPMKRYLDQVLVQEGDVDAETKRKNELRRKKVEKELKQLQGWTSD